MNYKLWAGLLLALTASVYPAALRAGQNAAKAPSWQQVLQKENKKAVSRGASSVLGTSVTANVRLISAQAQAAKVMENLFTSLLKKQRKSESEIQACKANYQDLQGIGMTNKLALPTLIALTSIALNKPTVSSLAVLGEISIAGTMIKVDELANALQVCLDSGAKKVLLPITSAADLGTVPSELIGCFNLIFYQSAEDAVFKALGVE